MTTFMHDITPDKKHSIREEGEELDITAERARALVKADLIYVCEEHSVDRLQPGGLLVYHITPRAGRPHPDSTWAEVDEKLREGS